MHRFYTQALCRVGEEAELLPEEARHAAQVLRLAPGDAVELLDGERLFVGVLARVDKQSAAARVEAQLPGREPRVRVTLFQGLCKGDKLEGVVRKCTELGVHAIQPLEMARCVQRLDAKKAEAACERWRRIAREATKQCGRAWTPEIYLPAPIADASLAARWAEQDMIVVPWEEAEQGALRALLGHLPGDGVALRIGLVIGPEGGITEGEISQLHGFGARSVTLGPRILRAETAGMAALAAILALCGELE